ncbi:MAG: glycerol-3-phosphate dehydrogenase/oxidase [Cyclobacteriaceae bacterium]
MDRKKNLHRVKGADVNWDLVVIGGGASGLGVALDGLSRGLKVLLLEKSDFAKGTSSKSTKLVHGGVRYLAQGEIGLVFEALKERGRLLKNAPHLTENQLFIIPLYSLWDRWKYSIGLKLYDWMAGKLRLGKSRFISKDETISKLPQIRQKGLRGGIVYHDGQFDDARLALMVAKTCDQMGGCMLNYTKVNDLNKDKNGKITGLKFRDLIKGQNYNVLAKTVINATGVFADKILMMDQPGASKMIRPSQGIHLVMDGSFLGGNDALMIPETSDGRVLFAVPWQGKLVVGTTDTLRKKPKMEPRPLSSEIKFILETAGQYLNKAPQRTDVLSVFAGLRPLAAPKEGSTKTKEISRSHKVIQSKSNLITITGGKWTTFRKMGEDTVDAHYHLHRLEMEKSQSAEQKIHGYTDQNIDGPLHLYGSEAIHIQKLQQENPDWGKRLHSDYPYTGAEVVWAVRKEMAQKIEDFLARRCRILLLDAKAAMKMAPTVAKIMSEEMQKEEDWVMLELEEFYKLAKKYLIIK